MGGRHMNRTWLLLIAALAALSLVVAACADPDEVTEDDPDDPDDVAVDDDVDDDDAPADDVDDGDAPSEITIDFVQDHEEVVPDVHVRSAPADRMFMRPVYDSLLTFTTDDLSEPEPWLAEEWEVNDDATEFTFHLREGVNFHDGTPLTADDVVFSLNRLQNIASAVSFLLDGVTDVRAEDDYTVVIETDETRPDIPRILANPSTGVVNSELLQDLGAMDDEGAAEEPPEVAERFMEESVGSGPYVMTHYEIDQQVIMEPNPEWWGSEPRYETVHFRPADVGVQLLNIQSGESDVAVNLSGEEVEQLNPDDFQIDEAVGSNMWVLAINLNPDELEVDSQEDFIEALKYALDYDSLAELGGPGAERNCGLVHLQKLGAIQPGDERCIEQDVDRAREALEQSGWDMDNDVFNLIVNPEHDRDGIRSVDLSSRIQQQWGEIGLDVNLDEMAPTVHNEVRDSGEGHNGYITPTSMRWPDPAAVGVYWQPGGGGGMIGDQYRCCMMRSDDPDIIHEPLEGQEELEETVRAAIATADDDEREQLYLEWQELSNEIDPMIPMAQGSRALVVQQGIPEADAYHPVWEIELPRFAGALPE